MQQQQIQSNLLNIVDFTNDIDGMLVHFAIIMEFAFELVEYGVESRILDDNYEMAHLYADNILTFEDQLNQFLVFFHNYISNEGNKTRITSFVGNLLNMGSKLPFEIRHPLGFD